MEEKNDIVSVLDNDDEPDKDPHPGMTFLDHLEDLRWTLFSCIMALVISCVIVAFFLTDIAGILSQPLEWAYGSAEEAKKNLVTVRPMGVFSVLIQVVFLGGLGIALPFMIFFIAKFISPGLSGKEKKVLLPGCVLSLILFLAGSSLTYFFILPFSLAVSIKFNNLLGFDLLWAASDYYSLVVWMTIAIGVSFEFPLVIIILSYIGILPVETLQKQRRLVFIIIMVLAAFITPGGDPISLLCLTVPMYLLYELAIFISKKLLVRKALNQDLE